MSRAQTVDVYTPLRIHSASLRSSRTVSRAEPLAFQLLGRQEAQPHAGNDETAADDGQTSWRRADEMSDPQPQGEQQEDDSDACPDAPADQHADVLRGARCFLRELGPEELEPLIDELAEVSDES